MSLQGNVEGTTLKGSINKLTELRGYSAYEIAILNGFKGTEEEWLDSLNGGPRGPQGPQGPRGLSGANGTDGKSAYQLAVDAGFKGSVDEWLASLAGATGARGVKGDKGDPGDDYVITEADKEEIAAIAKEGAIGDIESAINTILSIQKTLIVIETSTFTLNVNGTKYTLEFKKGMTWAEWCTTNYNTIGISVNDSGAVGYNGFGVIDPNTGFGETGDNPIEDDYTYFA